MNKFKLAEKYYKEVFTDSNIITNISEVIDEIVSGNKWSDSTSMHPFYTCGELKKVSGFWNDEYLLKGMIDMYQSRALRGCFIQAGMDVNDPRSMLSPYAIAILGKTGVQRDRVWSIIKIRANNKYNIPLNEIEAKLLRERIEAMEQKTFTDTKLQ